MRIRTSRPDAPCASHRIASALSARCALPLPSALRLHTSRRIHLGGGVREISGGFEDKSGQQPVREVQPPCACLKELGLRVAHRFQKLLLSEFNGTVILILPDLRSIQRTVSGRVTWPVTQPSLHAPSP